MAEIEDEFPLRNLPGKAEIWGRAVQERLRAVEKVAAGLAINTETVQRIVATAQDDMIVLADDVVASGATPAAPENLTLLANDGLFRVGGKPVSLLSLAWSAVFVDVNDLPIDVTTYEVWVREFGADDSEGDKSVDQGPEVEDEDLPVEDGDGSEDVPLPAPPVDDGGTSTEEVIDEETGPIDPDAPVIDDSGDDEGDEEFPVEDGDGSEDIPLEPTEPDDGGTSTEEVIAEETGPIDPDAPSMDGPDEGSPLDEFTGGTAYLSTSQTSGEVEVTPGKQVAVAVRVRSTNGVWSGFSRALIVTGAAPDGTGPRPPQNLHVISNDGVFADNNAATAKVVIGWDAVTEDTRGEPVVVLSYEVWQGTADSLGYPVASTTETQYGTVVPSGSTNVYRVRALSNLATYSDWSAPVSVIGGMPLQDLTPPSAPSLKTARNIVAAYWDGLLSTGATPRAWRHVTPEVGIEAPPSTEGGAFGPIVWTTPAQPVPARGTALISAPMGSRVSVRFVPLDQLGRVGTTSATARIITLGVSGPDIEANSVSTNHLMAGAVTVDKLEAGIGGKLDISANSMVEIIVGTQSAQSNDLADLTGRVDDNADAIIETQDQAGMALGQAQDAALAAGSAQELAENAANDIAEQRTVYQFTPTGARIQTPEGDQALVLAPGRISLEEAGVALTYWESGRMVVAAMDVEEIILSNHRVEKMGTGTAVKWVG